MRKALLGFIILFLISFSLKSQISYIVMDSVMKCGVAIHDGLEFQKYCSCNVETKSGIESYSPKVVKEYGLPDGRVFVAKWVTINTESKWVFFERLVNGKVSLYFYMKRGYKSFFIEKGNSGILELTKVRADGDPFSYKYYLEKLISDCQNIDSKMIKSIVYRKKSLIEIVKKYNNCK